MRFLSQRGFTLIELSIWLVMVVFVLVGCNGETEKPPPLTQRSQTPVVSKILNMKDSRYIAVNDRRWNAPLLFEISEKTILNNDFLNYYSYRTTILISKIRETSFHKKVFEFSDFVDFELNCHFSTNIPRKLFMEFFYQLNEISYSKKMNICSIQNAVIIGYNDNTYREEKKIHLFGESIFNTIIVDANTTKSGFALWLYNVGQHEPLFKAVKLLLEQYHDLAERLTVLHEGRAKIIREYGEGSDVKALVQDIKQLSALGWELTKVTKRFFVAIKPRMVKLEVAATRQKALAGLRTFENEIDSAQTTSSQSLDDIIANIDQAVRKLERAINQ
jgi:hypothetical protein